MDEYLYFLATGTILPDVADIRSIVVSEWQEAFGTDLITTNNTPQGVMIDAETLARATFLQNNANVGNQLNPNLAGGIFLDAVGQLTGIQRTAQSYSFTVETFNGVPGTTIPTTVILADGDGNQYSPITPVSIGVGGTITGIIQALLPGPVVSPAGTITTIVNASGVLGLETVTNAADSTPGAATQSDAGFRTYRKNTLAVQGNSLAEAVTSGLTAVPNVFGKPSFRENVKDTNQTIDGILMTPHSMYTCVAGGTDLDCATAIVTKKSGGCNYVNGKSTHPVSVAYTDPSSGQISSILFDRPDIISILVKVTVTATASVPDPTTSIKQAVLDYQAGKVNGVPGFIVGNSVSCFEIAGAINFEVPGIYINNVEISLVSPISYSNAVIPIALWQQASVDDSSITVVVL